jgi:hypothetical protein
MARYLHEFAICALLDHVDSVKCDIFIYLAILMVFNPGKGWYSKPSSAAGNSSPKYGKRYLI